MPPLVQLSTEGKRSLKFCCLGCRSSHRVLLAYAPGRFDLKSVLPRTKMRRAMREGIVLGVTTFIEGHAAKLVNFLCRQRTAKPQGFADLLGYFLGSLFGLARTTAAEKLLDKSHCSPLHQ